MKKLILFISIQTILNLTLAQDNIAEYHQKIEIFINCLKNENPKKLTTLVDYPLKRKHPLPDIKNENDFIYKYVEIFDDSLKKTIINSDIINDWLVDSWRGIMLNNGIIWLDYDGKLIAVNYHSNAEKIKRKELIENEKKSVHKVLREFQEPVLLLETEKSIIRIDKLNNGKYRYASWPIGNSMNKKPEIIIEGGKWVHMGSGGNNKYSFIKGDTLYECSINIIGSVNTPPAHLTIYQNEIEIHYESASIINK